MTTIKRLHGVLSPFIFIGVILFAVNASSDDSVPESLMGSWRVIAVRLDTTFTRKTYYNYNDPNLIGHEIVISKNIAKAKMPEKTVCIGPVFKRQLITMNALIESTMGKQEDSSQAEAVKRYELPVDGGKNLQVVWVGCKEGDLGPDTPLGPEGYNWIARLSPDKIAMRWYDNTILLLKRNSK